MGANVGGGRIDIHGVKDSFATALASLKSDKRLSVRNRDFILAFLRDAELGKTVRKGQKKKIGLARRLKYVSCLKTFALWLGKDFDRVVQEDMERVISDLENDRLRRKDGNPYSEESKVDFKKLVKKFYKWLLGNNESYPEFVEWFDTSVREKDIPALTRQEVEKLLEHSSNLKVKVAIMVLFDSGARIEEFLNMRLKHLTRKEDYYMVRIEYSKTRPRTVSLPLCTKLLDEFLKEQNLNDPEAQLFPVTYDAFRMMLGRLGRKVLKKPVYPHLLRHSSATYYANIERNYFRFCKRYGWAFGSKMAQRYIDRAGIDEQETAKAVQVDEVSKVRTENVRMREDMRRLQAQLSQLDKINIVLDEAFRNYPEFRKIVKAVAFQKVKEEKI
jgi:integrase